MRSDSFLFPLLLSFGISAAAGPLLIPLLRRVKAAQTVREDGPGTHLKKTGTPTMGGILFLLSMGVTSVLYGKAYPRIVPILFLTFGFGLIGFLDDYIKVILHRSMGLSVLQKLAAQLLVTGLFACYLVQTPEVSLAMRIPFLKGYYIDFGRWNVVLLFAVVIGTVNGANFTDGLDGLLGSVTVLVAIFFSVAAVGTNAGIFPITCAAAGALLGFLLFNVHPASVFMGDTGSLALGGFLAASAYSMQMPLFLPIVGLIYVTEVLSVMAQVIYYKISGGRRLLKMAPLHHHFELCGFSETQITACFSIITALLCLAALAGL